MCVSVSRLGCVYQSPVERLHERAALLEVERRDLVGAPAVQVDRALVRGVVRARDVDRAEQLARAARRRSRRCRGPRERSATSAAGKPSGCARDVGAVRAPAQLARGDEHVGGAPPARAERRVVGRLERALVRGAQHVRGVDLLVLVVEDRRLHRAVEELVGVAAEELVERVLARDVDRQPAPAAPRAAPHLPQRGDRARERHADRRVERADVDAELERVGGDHAEQLALDEPVLELAPLLGGVARAVGRDPLGEVAAAHVLERERARSCAISSTALRDFMNTIVRAPSRDQLGEQVGRLGQRRAPRARASRR